MRWKVVVELFFLQWYYSISVELVKDQRLFDLYVSVCSPQVLPLERKMTAPEDLRGFNGVLNTGMILVTCGYIAVGFFGYLKYGDAVHGSITLNLPPSDK